MSDANPNEQTCEIVFMKAMETVEEIPTSILMVDDTPSNLLALNVALGHLGYELIQAGSGDKALRILADRDVAVILMDVKMPGMNGFEAAEIIRSNMRTKYTPILFLTAFDERDEEVKKGYELGAVDYLFKPIDPVILCAKVNVMVDLYRQREAIRLQTMEVYKLRQQMAQKHLEQVEVLAAHDGLTGLYNHRIFYKLLEEELNRVDRHERPLSLLLIDIDHFKLVNDTHGHLTGDAVLIELSRMLKDMIRDIDLIFRYGGEEIAVLLPETDLEKAFQIAERIRNVIASHAFDSRNVEGLVISVSIGISSFSEQHNNAEILVDAADKAMYRAKANGRNRVCMASKLVNEDDSS